MPVQQGVMSAYQLMAHTHEAEAQGGQLSYVDAILEKPYIDAREYGLSIANNSVQNSAVLALIIAEQKRFHIPEGGGDYQFEDPLDIPDDVIIEGDGFNKTSLRYRGVGTYAVKIHEFSSIKGLSIWQTTDRVTERAGLLITGESNIIDDVRSVGFKYGYEFLGDGEGSSENAIFRMLFFDCLYDIYCTVANGGYVTENLFFGGRVQASVVANSTGIFLDFQIGELKVTTQRFFGVNISSKNRGVFNNGERNEFIGCRWENTGVDIEFGAEEKNTFICGGQEPDVIVNNSPDKSEMRLTPESTKFFYGIPTELTIAAGVIAVTQNYHLVDTEADAGADDLDTINGGVGGMKLTLQTVDAARDVTVTEAGNIMLTGANCVLTIPQCKLYLLYDATNAVWVERGRCTG